eukprot:687902-Rhodomonas_salina.2
MVVCMHVCTHGIPATAATVEKTDSNQYEHWWAGTRVLTLVCTPSSIQVLVLGFGLSREETGRHFLKSVRPNVHSSTSSEYPGTRVLFLDALRSFEAISSSESDWGPTTTSTTSCTATAPATTSSTTLTRYPGPRHSYYWHDKLGTSPVP